MPLARIDLKRGKSAAYRRAVRDGVYAALRETFDVPENDRFMLVTEYGDEDFIGMTGQQFAAGARFEMDHLRVGQVAPDFEVTDQEGTRFKLSDYRGRVVVLDFWGFV